MMHVKRLLTGLIAFAVFAGLIGIVYLATFAPKLSIPLLALGLAYLIGCVEEAA